jgi:hypothetical protein
VTASTLVLHDKSYKNVLGISNSLKQARLEMDFETFNYARWSVRENPLAKSNKSVCSKKNNEQDLDKKSKEL